MENSMMMLKMVRLETIVILLVGIEGLHSTYVSSVKMRDPDHFHKLSPISHVFLRRYKGVPDLSRFLGGKKK